MDLRLYSEFTDVNRISVWLTDFVFAGDGIKSQDTENLNHHERLSVPRYVKNLSTNGNFFVKKIVTINFHN